MTPPVLPERGDVKLVEEFGYGPGVYEREIEPVPEGTYEEGVPVTERGEELLAPVLSGLVIPPVPLGKMPVPVTELKIEDELSYGG